MFGNRRGAVISGEDNKRVLQTDSVVYEVEEIGDLAIDPQRYIHCLVTVRPKMMTNIIVGRKTQSKNISLPALPQFLVDKSLLSKFYEQVIRERRIIQGCVERRAWCSGATSNDVRKRISITN